MNMVLKENEQDFVITLEGQEILRIGGNWYNILKEALERRSITIPEMYEYARLDGRVLPQKTVDNWMRAACKRWPDEYQDFDLTTRETRRAPYDEFVLWYRSWRLKSRKDPDLWIDGKVGEVQLPEWMKPPTEEIK